MSTPYANKLTQLETCLDRAQRLLITEPLATTYAELVDMRVMLKALTENLRGWAETERDVPEVVTATLDDADAMFEALRRRADGYGEEYQQAVDVAGAARFQAQDRTLTPCPHCGGGELYLDDNAELGVRGAGYAALGARLVVCGNCGLLRLQARDGAVRTMARALGMRRLDLPPAERTPYR